MPLTRETSGYGTIDKISRCAPRNHFILSPTFNPSASGACGGGVPLVYANQVPPTQGDQRRAFEVPNSAQRLPIRPEGTSGFTPEPPRCDRDAGSAAPAGICGFAQLDTWTNARLSITRQM